MLEVESSASCMVVADGPRARAGVRLVEVSKARRARIILPRHAMCQTSIRVGPSIQGIRCS